MTNLFVSGATGFIGSNLVAASKYCDKVFAQGRNPEKLRKLENLYKNVVPVLSDIHYPLDNYLRDCQLVVHCAAQKFVHLAEKAVTQTINSNIAGTYNLAQAAGRLGIDTFIHISTDKASNPTNVYGMTKSLSEKIVLEVKEQYPNTRYIICRFGNIFGSAGSVIQIWKYLQRENIPLKITNPFMTRFMFSIKDAIKTLEDAVKYCDSGDIIIPRMGVVSVKDLLTLFPDCQTEEVGMLPGEKMYESLLENEKTPVRTSDNEYIILNKKGTMGSPLNIQSNNFPHVYPDILKKWFKELDEECLAL